MTNPPPPASTGSGPNPPQSDLLAQWGITPNPARPQKVNWFTQALWAYLAASVVMLLLSIIAVATASWWVGTGIIVASGIFGIVFHSLSGVIAWFTVKEKLGVFGAADPRNPLLIGLGILGLFSLFGVLSGWNIGWYAALSALLGLARLAAVGAAFALVFQPEFEQWLRSRPGNQRKTPPNQPYGQQPPPGYPQQPPQGNPQQQPVQPHQQPVQPHHQPPQGNPQHPGQP